MIIGVISGIIVLASDRVINHYMNFVTTWDISSLHNLLSSITDVIIIAVFTAAFLLWIIFYSIQFGISELKKK